MRLLVILIFALVAGPLVAQDRVAFLMGSHHVGAGENQFEEVNPGLFLTWDNWSVGAYRNSYGGLSLALTHEWALTDHVAVFAGVATYDGLMPIAGLQFTVGPVFVQVIPSDGRATDAIISFGLIVAQQ
jgi:hypothetical protein